MYSWITILLATIIQYVSVSHLLAFSLFSYVHKHLVLLLYLETALHFISSSAVTFCLIQSQTWWLWCLVCISNEQITYEEYKITSSSISIL